MESQSSNPSVSSASATGSESNKVGLKSGHSLLDWIRYIASGKDLTSTGGKVIEVSYRELAKHNTKEDAWIAFKGKVYNVTRFLNYHPGGQEEFMRAAGKDATDLFYEIHHWVNAEFLLEKCLVGVLKKKSSFEENKWAALKPGHSLMDWIRYTDSGKDLTSTGGRVREVSYRELAKHNTKEGNVYNVTPFLDYHPGGQEEFMRAAGTDATNLFYEVHDWVNAEFLLEKCFVGVLKKAIIF